MKRLLCLLILLAPFCVQAQAVNHSPEMQKVRVDYEWYQKIEIAEQNNRARIMVAEIIADYRGRFGCPLVWGLADGTLLDEDQRRIVWQLSDLYWLYLFHVPTQWEYVSISRCGWFNDRVVWEYHGVTGTGIHFCIPLTFWGYYRPLNAEERKGLEIYFGVYKGKD